MNQLKYSSYRDGGSMSLEFENAIYEKCVLLFKVKGFRMPLQYDISLREGGSPQTIIEKSQAKAILMAIGDKSNEINQRMLAYCSS